MIGAKIERTKFEAKQTRKVTLYFYDLQKKKKKKDGCAG